MRQYGSWINVSDFYIQVYAENGEEARKKIQDELDNLTVRVTDENGYTDLSCTITDIKQIV